MKSLVGAKGEAGAPGQDGVNSRDGAPSQSAYQLWLAAGNTGTMDDFMASLRGQKGHKGDVGPAGRQGPQGVAGIPNAQKVTICVIKRGNSYHLGFAGDCASEGSDVLRVYIPV